MPPHAAETAAAAPAPVATNPLRVIADDVVTELRSGRRWPPGENGFDVGRTLRFTHDPLPLLLALYREHGPVFSFRILHQRQVFMLGPEANHYVTLSHPENFRWRDSHFRQLIPLLGDGLLTIDGRYHDRARRIMMPAFHREQIEASVEVMVDEAERALESWEPGRTVDVYAWMRRLAMRIAMRALLGLDPDDRGHGAAAVRHFERGLAYYGISAFKRLLRGPFTPWQRMLDASRALDAIVYEEIRARRARPDPDRLDVLSLLLSARDESGAGLTDREVRDQVMTLMFAGHDTSTSTTSFLIWELVRHPEARAALLAEQEQVLHGRPPSAAHLHGGLPQLDMALDETLRLYPPAWVGPRRAVRDFEFAGTWVPAGAYVNYCSWASHRLPEVFPDPDAFVPERFEPARKARLPRGAYVPFGGGTRICIGKRFGQMMVKVAATAVLQNARLEAVPGHEMRFALEPTLGPRDGLPMNVVG